MAAQVRDDAVEEIGQGLLPIVGLEDVLLFDRHPGQLLAPAGELVALPHVLLLGVEQLAPRRQPLPSVACPVLRHPSSPFRSRTERLAARSQLKRSMVPAPSSTWSGFSSVTLRPDSFGDSSRTRSARIAASYETPSFRPQFSESGTSVKSITSTSKWTTSRSQRLSIPVRARRAAPSGSAATVCTSTTETLRLAICSRSNPVACCGPQPKTVTCSGVSSGSWPPAAASSGAAPSTASMWAMPIQSRAPSVTLFGTLRSAWLSK